MVPKWFLTNHIQKEKKIKEGVAESREYGLVQFSRTGRTLLSNVGEKSCMLDFKWCVLATGKWHLPHICFPPFDFSPFLNFVHCMIEKQKVQKNIFCMLELSLAPFSFYKITKNIFWVSKSLENHFEYFSSKLLDMHQHFKTYDR